jgi:hypothetical protein
VVAVEVVQRGEKTAREGEKAQGCKGVEDGFRETGEEAVNTLKKLSSHYSSCSKR